MNLDAHVVGASPNIDTSELLGLVPAEDIDSNAIPTPFNGVPSSQNSEAIPTFSEVSFSRNNDAVCRELLKELTSM